MPPAPMALPKKMVDQNPMSMFTLRSYRQEGEDRPIPQLLEGQVIVVQEADLVQTRKVIPDLAKWT